MKKMKKVLAVILSLAMVLGMSLTTFAAENTNATGSENDKVDITITGLSPKQTVTLYKIAEGDYQGSGAGAFVKYVWAEGISEEIQKKAETGLSSTEITSIVNDIKDNSIKAIGTPIVKNDVGTTYIENVGVGAYIAVITGASDGYIYNPILLTATYNATGVLVGGEIAANTALYGGEAVAKRTEADVDKEITSGTTNDTSIPDNANENKTKYTASVGDVLGYTITPTIPTYPKNAKNKTLFVSDKMSAGLDFDVASLRIKVGDAEPVAAVDGKFIYDGKEIASVDTTRVQNGFYLNFKYDNILGADDTPYDIKVTYSARVNENAVVGEVGNKNEAKMYYANDPTNGSTFEPDDEHPTPDGAEGVIKKEDEEIVYTYQISFLKTGQGEDAAALAGATFGIYKDSACTQLVDVVVTNEKGYAVSTSVAAGMYYVKEIQAPTGYSLNDTVYPVEAKWTSATKTVTRAETEIKYTTEKDEAISDIVVGSIKNGVFYNTLNLPDSKPAYILSKTETSTQEVTPIENEGVVGGTVVMGDAIPNTKLSNLPSTGGIGTTIFTIGGCAIMIIAAALFFASRRRAVK